MALSTYYLHKQLSFNPYIISYLKIRNNWALPTLVDLAIPIEIPSVRKGTIVDWGNATSNSLHVTHVTLYRLKQAP